jgi:hypothetical protein
VEWNGGELGLGARLQPAWSAGAAAEIEVLAPDKSRVLTRSLELSASSSTFMMRVPEEGVLPPGDYSVRVRLKPASGQGLAVQDAVRVTIAEASPLGDPVLWRKGPLARLPYVETADPRFRRNERLRLEVPFPAEGAVPTVRLLDRTGKALQMSPDISERPDSSGAFRWMVIEGPIASLGTGDYAIELTLNDSSRVTAFRVIP